MDTMPKGPKGHAAGMVVETKEERNQEAKSMRDIKRAMDRQASRRNKGRNRRRGSGR